MMNLDCLEMAQRVGQFEVGKQQAKHYPSVRLLIESPPCTNYQINRIMYHTPTDHHQCCASVFLIPLSLANLLIILKKKVTLYEILECQYPAHQQC